MNITKHQKELMKHTVSGPNRNWFATNYWGKDSDNFELLIADGYARKQGAPSWSGDDVIYSLTDKGKEYIDGL